jgi:hypothetical protein
LQQFVNKFTEANQGKPFTRTERLEKWSSKIMRPIVEEIK